MKRGRDRLAVALDVAPSVALELGARLAPEVGFLKVGLSLFVEEGPAIVRQLRGTGARIFLDLKLHDIPNTVELAARAAGRLDVALLTVHAAGGEAMVAAAVRGAEQGASEAGFAPPQILAVTVLTSLDVATVHRVGLKGGPRESVRRLAALAVGAGAHGIVCSPREAMVVRAAVGTKALIVTPGVRPEGSDAGDQARTETPARAIAAGADVVVVGRPVTGAADPLEAVRALVRELGGR